MHVKDIYKLATYFYKTCLGQGVAGKQWILDCFFRCFGNKYNLLYDYFESSEGDKSYTDVRSVYGAEVRFRFLDKTKDDPDNVYNIVKTCLQQNSALGAFIHHIDVKQQYGYVYEVWIIFDPSITQIES